MARWLSAVCLLITAANVGLYAADANVTLKARAILRKHCAECHGDQARRSEFTVLERNGMNRAARPFLVPGSSAGSQLMHLVRDGSMPPGSRAKLSAVEVQALDAYIQQNAPNYPRHFDDLYVLESILADVTAQPLADRPHLRYISLTETVLPDAEAFNLEPAREALRGNLNQISKTPLARLDSVDLIGSVIRVDLRKTGWNLAPFERKFRVDGQTKTEPSGVNLFDVMLLEYPLGFMYPESPAYLSLSQEWLGPAKQFRPLAFVRGDWLADVFLKTSVAREFTRVLEIPDPKPAAMPLFSPVPAAAGANAMKRVPVLPLDGVTRPNIAPDPDPFKLVFETWDAKRERPKEKFAPGDSVVFYILSRKDIFFDIVSTDVAGKRSTFNLGDENRAQGEKEKFLAGRTGMGFRLKMNVTGRESLTIFASEQAIPAGEVLTTTKLMDERVIHPFYSLPGMNPNPAFDPAKVVKKTHEYTIEKP